jgi:hypothetical protein
MPNLPASNVIIMTMQLTTAMSATMSQLNKCQQTGNGKLVTSESGFC